MSERDNSLPNRYLIDGVEVDQAALRVKAPTGEVSLEPKVMQVLCELVAQSGVVVSRQHLIDTVWNVTYGGDESLTRAISILRKSFGNPGVIETVPRRGYRLIAHIELLPDNGPSWQRPDMRDRPDGERQSQPAAVSDTIRVKRRQPVWRWVWMSGLLVAVLAIFGFSRVWMSGSNETATTPVLVKFDTSEDDLAALEARLPGFQSGLAGANRFWGVFAEGEQPSAFRVNLQVNSDQERDAFEFRLFKNGVTEPVFVTEFVLGGEAGDVVSERVVLLASHVTKCGDDLISAMSLDRQSNISLLRMLFDLCYSNGGSGTRESLDDISSRILTTFPEEPGVEALHAVIILSEPDQHWLGQRDIRQPEILQTASRLLDDARQTDATRPIVAMGDILLAARQADLAEQDSLLSEIGPGSWLGLRALSLRIALLRQTGRLSEAEYLLTTATTAWPNDFNLRSMLGLVQVQRGEYELGLSTMQEAARLATDSPLVNINYEVAFMFYGEVETARDIVSNAPPSLQPCLTAFLDVRSGARETFGDECSVMEITQRARMLALVGEMDRAFELISLFDPGAPGVGAVLHYSEFAPLWLEDRMWKLATAFGMVDYWRTTGTRPDFCYQEAFLEICAEQI